MWVFEVSNLSRVRIDEPAPDHMTVVDCLLSRDRSAVVYQNESLVKTVVIRIAEFAPVRRIVDVTVPKYYERVSEWMPDGSGLIISAAPGADCLPWCDLRPAALTLNGELRSLPFEAGDVMAVVP
jgi:hypothetical protein